MHPARLHRHLLWHRPITRRCNGHGTRVGCVGTQSYTTTSGSNSTRCAQRRRPGLPAISRGLRVNDDCVRGQSEQTRRPSIATAAHRRVSEVKSESDLSHYKQQKSANQMTSGHIGADKKQPRVQQQRRSSVPSSTSLSQARYRQTPGNSDDLEGASEVGTVRR